jgi:NAD(P)H-nitrite reductase large subunit
MDVDTVGGKSEKISFSGADMSTKLKLIGVDVGSIGDAHGKKPGSLSYPIRLANSQVQILA